MKYCFTGVHGQPGTSNGTTTAQSTSGGDQETVGEQSSGGGDETSGGDDKSSGGDDETSGGDDDTSGREDESSGGDDEEGTTVNDGPARPSPRPSGLLGTMLKKVSYSFL